MEFLLLKGLSRYDCDQKFLSGTLELCNQAKKESKKIRDVYSIGPHEIERQSGRIIKEADEASKSDT